MTPQVKEFIKNHKDKLQGNVLEVGSLNVNGSARDVINVSLGIDMRPGNGVDLVCNISDFNQTGFDACVSTETLEHVEDWKSFVINTWNAVKDGGYLVMTMASMKKGRHAYPDDYWRFTTGQIREIYPSAEWVGDVGRISIGWVVKKDGFPNLDVVPYKVP